MSYIEKIDKNRIPQHIAIIMDGNGRWAKQRGKERTYGHQAGAETVHKIIEDAARLGVKYLTLYTFSTENWNRPQEEVTALMNLLLDSIEEETLMKNNIRFRIIGDIKKLPAEVQEGLSRCIEHTANNTGTCLVLALSYSSRWEMTEAVRQIATLAKTGEISPEQVTTCYGNVLIRSFIFVIHSGRTSIKKNSAKPFMSISKESAGSAKQVNKSANIIRNIKL